jgi:hypothetical protein
MGQVVGVGVLAFVVGVEGGGVLVGIAVGVPGVDVGPGHEPG